MKIALDLQPCYGKRSGIGTYTYELARNLKGSGELEFCGNIFDFSSCENSQEALNGLSLPVRRCNLMPFGVYRRIWHILPLPYSRLFPPVDVNLFFDYIVPPGVKGKVITTIHDMGFLRYPETVSETNRRRIQRDIHYSLERSDRIATISAFSRRELISLLGAPEEKIILVPPAPSCVPLPLEERRALLEHFSLSTPYLLYVGTIEPRKNLSRLIKAFALLKKEMGIPHRLVLAGGKGWNYQDIYDTAAEMDCASDIAFVGYVTAQEKTALYQGASAFVFPSLYEGFGIPPLEAMLCGCPVICANTASLPEVVGDAAELVDPLDEHRIAEGIWHVLSDRTYATAMVERGYRQAARFTWQASAQALTDACLQLMEES